jgi:uncharacterized repeat protein (TIGR03803 family)
MTARFRALYNALPKQARKDARSAYKDWQRDISAPSVEFKEIKLRKNKSIWSVRTSLGWLAVGIKPTDAVAFDSAGNLYGTTSRGSTNGHGEIFEVAANTGAVMTIAPLTNTDYNASSLIVDGSGNLFGTTTVAGYDGQGRVFKLTSSGAASAPEPDTAVSLPNSSSHRRAWAH